MEIIKAIFKMDTKSDEFFEIYKVVSDKHWTFKDPDIYQQSGAILVKIAERADADQVILTSKIAVEVYEMLKEKRTASVMRLDFEDGREFRIDMYQDGIEKEKLETILEGAAKAMTSGNITVNGKKAFGKNYFKGKKK